MAGVLTVALVVLAGCAPGPAGPGAPRPVRLLQMNLCNSGIAECFSGRSVTEAATVIRAQIPDVVTLNEVCSDDVSVLERVLAEAVPGATTSSRFQPARDRRTGRPYGCLDGGEFGIGVVIADLRARDDDAPVVVGADLNLGPDLGACV